MNILIKCETAQYFLKMFKFSDAESLIYNNTKTTEKSYIGSMGNDLNIMKSIRNILEEEIYR